MTGKRSWLRFYSLKLTSRDVGDLLPRFSPSTLRSRLCPSNEDALCPTPLLLSFFVSPRLGGNLHPFLSLSLSLSRLSGSISLSSPSHYSPVYRETILSLFEFSGT